MVFVFYAYKGYDDFIELFEMLYGIIQSKNLNESGMEGKISENQKITLTFGQLKRLVAESIVSHAGENEKEIGKRKILNYL